MPPHPTLGASELTFCDHWIKPSEYMNRQQIPALMLSRSSSASEASNRKRITCSAETHLCDVLTTIFEVCLFMTLFVVLTVKKIHANTATSDRGVWDNLNLHSCTLVTHTCLQNEPSLSSFKIRTVVFALTPH